MKNTYFHSKLVIMKQIYLSIHGFVFGVRAKGEKPMEPTLKPERPMDMNGFNEWCQHIRNEIIFGGKEKRVSSYK